MLVAKPPAPRPIATVAIGAIPTGVTLSAATATSATPTPSRATMPDRRGRPRRVRVLAGADFPATQLLDRRLVEVVLHHTDRDAGYGPAQWPVALEVTAMPEPMQTQREHRRASR